MTTRRRARGGRSAKSTKSTKGAQSAKRAEESVCAVCGKFYPATAMTWHLVDRVHDGFTTRERVGLCARDAEKVVAGERPHLQHVRHDGKKLPHLHTPAR